MVTASNVLLFVPSTLDMLFHLCFRATAVCCLRRAAMEVEVAPAALDGAQLVAIVVRCRFYSHLFCVFPSFFCFSSFLLQL